MNGLDCPGWRRARSADRGGAERPPRAREVRGGHATSRRNRWTVWVAVGRVGWVIEAVVFDLDGVLADSEPMWEQVRRQVVAEHVGHWPADAQRRLMGMSTGEWAPVSERGLGRRPAARGDHSFGDRAHGGRYTELLPLMPGAAGAVHRLAARWPLGLASSPVRRLEPRSGQADSPAAHSARRRAGRPPSA